MRYTLRKRENTKYKTKKQKKETTNSNYHLFLPVDMVPSATHFASILIRWPSPFLLPASVALLLRDDKVEFVIDPFGDFGGADMRIPL